MTDKVQKIREEVVRMHNLLPVVDGDNIYINYADRICTTLEMYIDSLQKEPVSEELEQVINNYLAIYWGGEKEKQDWPFLKKMAIHFADWQKKQMMKDAVKVIVKSHPYFGLLIQVPDSFKCELGDEISIILNK